MNLIYYAIERSFAEHLSANLSKGSGEVLVFEFPTAELGSHTYSVHFVSHDPLPTYQGYSLEGTAKGRTIESLVQVDAFRLPTEHGEPDVAGCSKMLSRVSDVFKGSWSFPLKSYGATPTATTTGTQVGLVKINEMESSKQAFDPDPNLRRYTQTFRLRSQEVF